ncbi:unnamed protein product [Timema podura]|uniref:Diablo homolog, mitochondrial n=1 Tax=Timema podura TaxID=61482 RepID=A0ABN7P7B1_TIMPD|nr:unnamed protein product [Timema podura]
MLAVNGSLDTSRCDDMTLPKLDSGQVIRTGMKTALLLSVQCHTREDCKCDKTLQPVQIPGLDKVSHEALIRQACAGTLETSSQLITFTTTAILDTAHKYRDSMNRLMNLLEESMDPNVSEHYKSSLNDRIVEVRVESAELRNCLLVSSVGRYRLQCPLDEMSGFMDHVTKLATASAEIAYLAGAEYVSTSMCERINSANKEVSLCVSTAMCERINSANKEVGLYVSTSMCERANSANKELQIEMDKTKKLEEQLLKVQAEFVQKMCNEEK